MIEELSIVFKTVQQAFHKSTYIISRLEEAIRSLTPLKAKQLFPPSRSFDTRSDFLDDIIHFSGKNNPILPETTTSTLFPSVQAITVKKSLNCLHLDPFYYDHCLARRLLNHSECSLAFRP